MRSLRSPLLRLAAVTLVAAVSLGVAYGQGNGPGGGGGRRGGGGGGGRRGGGGGPRGGGPGGPSGGSTQPAPPPPRVPVVRFLSGGAGWVWLRGAPQKTTVYTASAGGAAQVVAEGAGWTDLAAEGKSVWIANSEAGTILEVQASASATPRPLLEKLSEPGGLLAKNGTLYWAEHLNAESTRYPWVPSTGPRLRVSSRSAAGATAVLGDWPAAAGKAFGPGPEDLLISSDALYLRIHRPATTEIVRFPLAGGAPQRVAIEPGAQQAVMAGDGLYWSAPSPEVADTADVRAVKRWRPNQQSVLISDWLPGNGRLALLNGAPYWISSTLYAVPSSPGPAAIVRHLGWKPKETDGVSIIDVDNAAGPRSLGGGS